MWSEIEPGRYWRFKRPDGTYIHLYDHIAYWRAVTGQGKGYDVKFLKRDLLLQEVKDQVEAWANGR